MNRTVLKSLGVGLGMLFLLTGCMSANNHTMSSNSSMNHDSMMGGNIPANMIVASNPKFSVGTVVILQDDHMPGMNGAEATIVAAYDTTLYEVSYTPVNGGAPVTHHKWVVAEELSEPSNTYEVGATVVLNAEHMPGMKGASATIDAAVLGVAYIVDYTPTTGGAIVKNHMWFSESELVVKTA